MAEVDGDLDSSSLVGGTRAHLVTPASATAPRWLSLYCPSVEPHHAEKRKHTVSVVSATWETVTYSVGKTLLSYFRSTSRSFSSGSDKLPLHSHIPGISNLTVSDNLKSHELVKSRTNRCCVLICFLNINFLLGLSHRCVIFTI